MGQLVDIHHLLGHVLRHQTPYGGAMQLPKLSMGRDLSGLVVIQSGKGIKKMSCFHDSKHRSNLTRLQVD